MTQNSARGVLGGASKTTRVIIFLRVVYKLEKVDLLWAQVAAEAGAGNAGKNSAVSTLIRPRDGVGLMGEITIIRSVAALKRGSTRIITAAVGITATVSGGGNELSKEDIICLIRPPIAVGMLGVFSKQFTSTLRKSYKSIR